MEEDEPAFLEDVDYSAESDDENDPELEPAHLDLNSDHEFNLQDSLTWGLRVSLSKHTKFSFDTQPIQKYQKTELLIRVYTNSTCVQFPWIYLKRIGILIYLQLASLGTINIYLSVNTMKQSKVLANPQKQKK